MNKKLKIYIAGPYTPREASTHDCARVAHQNTQRAIRVGLEVIKKGHYPFIPHLSHYIHLETEKDLGEYYMEYDYVWLDLCDALLVLEDSPGVNLEFKRAVEKGKIIFFRLDEVPTLD